MKSIIGSLAPLIMCLSVVTARGETILIDPGNVGDSFASETIPFNDINGTSVDGSTLSLDFVFDDMKHLELAFNDASATDYSYDVTLVLFHSGASMTAPGSATVYLSDEMGSNIANPSSVSSMAAGNFLAYSAGFPESVVDGLIHHDVHFEVPLLNLPGKTITSAQITLAISSPEGEIIVGEWEQPVQQVATASTLVGLIGIVITGMLGHGWLRKHQQLRMG